MNVDRDSSPELGCQWPWQGPSFEEVLAYKELPIMAGGEVTTYAKAKSALQESVIYDSAAVSAALREKIGRHQLIALDTPDLKRKIETELRQTGKVPKIPDFVAVTQDGCILAIDSKRDLFSARAKQIETQTIQSLLPGTTFKDLITSSLYPDQSIESLQIRKGFFVAVDNEANKNFWSEAPEKKWQGWETDAQAKGKTLGPKPTQEEVVMLEIKWEDTLPHLPGWEMALDLMKLDHEVTNPFEVVDQKDGQRRDINYYSRLGAVCLSWSQNITSPVFQLRDEEAAKEHIQAIIAQGKNVGEIVTSLQQTVGIKRQVEHHIEELQYNEALNLGKVMALTGMKAGEGLRDDETEFTVPKRSMSAINNHIEENWAEIIARVVERAYGREKDWSALLQKISEDQQIEYEKLKTTMRQVLKEEITKVATQKGF